MMETLTGELRFIARSRLLTDKPGIGIRYILQQLWLIEKEEDGRLVDVTREWRDVPTVLEE